MTKFISRPDRAGFRLDPILLTRHFDTRTFRYQDTLVPYECDWSWSVSRQFGTSPELSRTI